MQIPYKKYDEYHEILVATMYVFLQEIRTYLL